MWNRLSTLGMVVLLAFAVLAAAAIFLRTRHPGQVTVEAAAVEECLAGYRRARTAPESAMVDAQRPVVSRGQATVALTCGAMRQMGHLR